MASMPTNLYDVTQPPDTQAANLLGQDARNLALNVQQRMGYISGPLASQWNPGNDVQPLNWTGLLFFATDTKQVFQWNGSAWVEITTTFLPTSLLNQASVRLAGQTAAIAQTTFYNVPATGAGIYRVTTDIIITTAGVSGTVEGIIYWNNGVVAQTSGVSFANVNTLGTEAASEIEFYAANGSNIAYGSQLNSIVGSPQYSYNIRLEYLG